MSADLTLLAPLVGAAIGEALHLDGAKAVSLSLDLSTLVNGHASGRDTTSALTDIGTTLAELAAAHSGNPTIVNAAKVIGDFPSAKANLEAGQAVVVASPHIDGRDCLLVLVAKGSDTSAVLGL